MFFMPTSLVLLLFLSSVFTSTLFYSGFQKNLLELKSNESILYFIQFSALIPATAARQSDVVEIECVFSLSILFGTCTGVTKKNKKRNVNHFHIAQYETKCVCFGERMRNRKTKQIMCSLFVLCALRKSTTHRSTLWL